MFKNAISEIFKLQSSRIFFILGLCVTFGTLYAIKVLVRNGYRDGFFFGESTQSTGGFF